MDADVVIVGGGPTGLVLAAELRLGGVRPVVLERRAELGGTPRASGVNGRVLDVLRYRGLLELLGTPVPAPGIPFGGLELDLGGLADPPLYVLHLLQPELERRLDGHVRGSGVEVRRGHRVTGLRQDGAGVSAEVRGPAGTYRVTARWLVGCDGAYSRVRELAGIPFPGTTYPQVNRLGQVAVPGTVRRLDNGDLDVPGLGRLRAGFTRTEHGVFAFGSRSEGDLLVQTTEDDPTDTDPAKVVDVPLTLAELRASIRRVLGADVPFTDASRLSRYRFQARLAERYRHGRVLLAGDAAHQFPATGVGLNTGMLDAVNLGWKLAGTVRGWAPDGLLDTYHHERRYAAERVMLQAQAQVALRRGHDPAADALRAVFRELCADEQPLRRIAAMVGGTDLRYPSPGAGDLTGDLAGDLAGAFVPDLSLDTDQGATSVAELMRAGRPVLLVLADRPDLLAAADGWRHRVDLHTATTDQPPADALLIRPDAHLAWAGADAAALRDALARWFGKP